MLEHLKVGVMASMHPTWRYRGRVARAWACRPVVDPVVVDELDDLARISAFRDKQEGKDHPLNQRLLPAGRQPAGGIRGL